MTLLYAGLVELGFGIPLRPAGAFYLYADIGHTGLDAIEFCRRLLEEYYVAATPGADFGKHDCGRYVRFAFTTGEAAIATALDRIRQALQAWGVQ
jgi:aspartate/methionine/tyrosine aminotransferase